MSRASLPLIIADSGLAAVVDIVTKVTGFPLSATSSLLSIRALCRDFLYLSGSEL
ncbi:hypothetical protein D3C77_783050 [compost metagenome]